MGAWDEWIRFLIRVAKKPQSIATTAQDIVLAEHVTPNKQ
jgi:hypothetical protein